MTTYDSRQDHWQDWCNLVLALWLFASPVLLNYGQAPAAAWNAYAVATVVAVLSLAAMLRFARWEEWINVIVGLWLIASPWLFGYTDIPVAVVNHALSGALVIAFAGWELAASTGEARSA